MMNEHVAWHYMEQAEAKAIADEKHFDRTLAKHLPPYRLAGDLPPGTRVYLHDDVCDAMVASAKTGWSE